MSGWPLSLALKIRLRPAVVRDPVNALMVTGLGVTTGTPTTVPRCIVERSTWRALATYEIPIEGREEWLAAARRAA